MFTKYCLFFKCFGFTEDIYRDKPWTGEFRKLDVFKTLSCHDIYKTYIKIQNWKGTKYALQKKNRLTLETNYISKSRLKTLSTLNNHSHIVNKVYTLQWTRIKQFNISKEQNKTIQRIETKRVKSKELYSPFDLFSGGGKSGRAEKYWAIDRVLLPVAIAWNTFICSRFWEFPVRVFAMHRGANSLFHHDDDNRVNNTCNYRRKSCICKFKYILFLRRHVKKT